MRETRLVSGPSTVDPIAAQRAAWQRLIGDDGPLDGLVRRHRERHRRYHGLEHVLAVVRHVEDLAEHEEVVDLGAVVAAAWFHDAVYEPRSSANERASARLARRDLAELGWDADRADTVATMIEGTAHHSNPPDLDTAVLFDADLAILGADREVYAAYVADVRAEYAHVDEEAWRVGRPGILRTFLERDRIFATSTGFERWEDAARANVAGEIAALAD